MVMKKLLPGQSFTVAGVAELNAKLTVSTNNDVDFHVDIPNVDSRRLGNNIAVRNLTERTEIILRPMDRAFPSRTTVFVSLILLADRREDEIEIDFPPFDVANLTSFSIGALSIGPRGLVIEAADLVADDGLDGTSSEIRSVARSTVGVDALPELRKRDVVVIVDVSASMQRSLSAEQFHAMCHFASGVLALAAERHTIRWCTSSAGSNPVVVPGSEIAALPERSLQFHEAGWGFDISRIPEHEAVVVISDGIPAAVMNRRYTHVLTPRPPLSTGGCTYTLVDRNFVDAVWQSRADTIAQHTEIMLNTLTGGK